MPLMEWPVWAFVIGMVVLLMLKALQRKEEIKLRCAKCGRGKIVESYCECEGNKSNGND